MKNLKTNWIFSVNIQPSLIVFNQIMLVLKQKSIKIVDHRTWMEVRRLENEQSNENMETRRHCKGQTGSHGR